MKGIFWPGMVAHACNSRTLGGRGEWITWGPEFETSLTNMVKPCLFCKKTKNSHTQWRVPVIPSTQEAEAGESFEPSRWSLQWVQMAPPHSHLGDRARLPLKKQTNKQKNWEIPLAARETSASGGAWEKWHKLSIPYPKCMVAEAFWISDFFGNLEYLHCTGSAFVI